MRALESVQRLADGSWRVRLIALGLALLLLGAGAIVLSFTADTPTEAQQLGRNAPINAGATDAADIAANNSPTVVRSPRNGRELVVANRIDSPRYSCALHFSSDGGATWSQSPVPAPPREKICYAPDAAFGADGTLYVSFVTLRGQGNVPNAAWLVRSTDGGETFSRPEKVLGKLAFQVRLVTDPTHARRLYLTWVQAEGVGLYRFERPGNPIRVMRSDDRGLSWGRPTQANRDDDARALAPSPVLGPGGRLYVLYLDLGDDMLDYEGAHEGKGGPPYPGRWKLVLARSQDRGQTWDHSVVEDRLVPTERFVAFIPPSPSLAVDPKSGRVYASFEDGRLGDADVWVWSLPGNGGTWEGPTRVNDNRSGDGTAQYRPKLAVSPDGRLDVIYYDRRADRANIMNEVSFQSSFDEGNSYTKRLRLSQGSFSSRIGFGDERDMPDIGSRLGLLSTGSRALAVWTDTRAGTQDSNKQDLGQGVVGFSKTRRLGDPGKYLLRFGGAAFALVGVIALGLGAVGRYPSRLAIR